MSEPGPHANNFGSKWDSKIRAVSATQASTSSSKKRPASDEEAGNEVKRALKRKGKDKATMDGVSSGKEEQVCVTILTNIHNVDL